MKNTFLGILAMLFFSYQASADSPLTSTEFYKAYEKLPIIQVAGNSNGLLTKELIKYLADKDNPTDVKIALINRLGWNIKGKKNASILIKYLKSKYSFNTTAELKADLSASDLICIAYLKSMDNYFDTKEELIFATAAQVKEPESYTINIIRSLIKAQDYVYKSYCQVFKIVDEVRSDEKLTIDFKKEASDIIFEYIDGYKKYCKNETSKVN
jgi:hypothetical protein